MRCDLRFLRDDGGVDVDDLVTGVRYKRNRLAQEIEAVGSAIAGIARREVLADVPQCRRAQQGIHGYLLAPVVHITAEDSDRTVTLRLRRPMPELPHVLSAPALAIAVLDGDRLWGSGPSDIYAVGTPGLILRYRSTGSDGGPRWDR